jgi:hypothetical protein
LLSGLNGVDQEPDCTHEQPQQMSHKSSDSLFSVAPSFGWEYSIVKSSSRSAYDPWVRAPWLCRMQLFVGNNITWLRTIILNAVSALESLKKWDLLNIREIFVFSPFWPGEISL